MAPIKEEKPDGFSFEVPIMETPITSESVEAKISETQDTIAPKKRGRKPGSTNKKTESTEVPEYVKQMFGPLVIGVHNGLLRVLKLSVMDKEQEKMVTEGYAMLLHKRIPSIIEKHGDIIAALGATAYVFGAKLTTETKIFDFGKSKEKTNNAEARKQYNDDFGSEGKREDGTS